MKPLTVKIIPIAWAAIIVLASCAEQKQPETTSESSTEAIRDDSKQSSTVPVDNGDRVNKKLDGLLSNLVKSVEKGLPTEAQELDSQLSVKDDMVAVEITYDGQRVTPDNIEAFKALGGRVDTGFQNKLYGWVPIAKIRAAAQPDTVWTVAAVIRVVHPVVDEAANDKAKSTDLKSAPETTDIKEKNDNENE